MGELRAPGGWRAMVDELAQARTLSFLAGFVALAIGAAIYLVNPWRPGDWLALAVTAIGGLWVAEGLLLLAAGERFAGLLRRILSGGAARIWAGFGALAGFALVAAALARL